MVLFYLFIFIYVNLHNFKKNYSSPIYESTHGSVILPSCTSESVVSVVNTEDTHNVDVGVFVLIAPYTSNKQQVAYILPAI